MSRFQMFASPLLGWYRCRSAACDPGRLRRTLGAPVRLRQTAPVRRCVLAPSHVPRLRTKAARVIVAPEDMLSELQADNRELARNLRSVHELCGEYNDVATARLIENWIEGTQRRAWVSVRSSWHVRPESDEPCLRENQACR